MSWFGYIRRAIGNSGREAAKQELIQSDPTAALNLPAPSQFASSVAELAVANVPRFTLYTARIMLETDPIVEFALNVRNSALMVAEVEVKAKNEQVATWVKKQWEVLWNKHRSKLLSAKKWGFAPLQFTFKQYAPHEGSGLTGLLGIEDVKDFAPENVIAQETHGKLVGYRIKNVKLRQPRAVWLTFNNEHSSPYGRGCLRRMYIPWFQKWAPHGAEKLIQLRMLKDAYIGDIFWYPPNQIVEVPDGAGGKKAMSWRDLARELGENRLSGSAQFLPSIWDDKGNRLLDYTAPQDVPGGSQVFDWRDGLDEGILRGAGIPIEVVKAQENGGFSGRSIPFMVVLSECTQELTDTVQCVDQQALRIMAWLNWGRDVDYEIKPKSLVESFAADAGGSPMGGAAIGGQAGQRPGMQQQQQQPPQLQQRQRAEQFDEASDLTGDLARIGALSAKDRIRSTASRLLALKKNELTPLPLLSGLIEQELRSLQRGISADLSASMLGSELIGQADVLTSIPDTFIPPPVADLTPPIPPSEPPSIASLLGPDEPSPQITFPAIDDALEILNAAPVASRPDYRQTAEAVRQGAFAITGDLGDAAVDDIRTILAENIATGPDREAFIEAVVERLGEGGPLSESRIENIFRTNTATALSNGQDRALQAPMVVDAFPYRAYYATTDRRVRANHIALERLGLNGTNIYRADDQTWARFRPPWDFQCLLPGTIIQGRIEAVLRSVYSGDAVELITASGQRLRVTINHPVLSDQGFVPAGSFKHGDNVLSYGGIQNIGRGSYDTIDRASVFHATYDPRRFSPDVHEQYAPTTVADVFASLALHRKFCRLPITANDLHGEAVRGDGYVDVVWADWELPLDEYADRLKRFDQFDFTSSDSLSASRKTTNSNSDLSFNALSCAARSGPSSATLSNDRSGITLESPPLRQLCIGTAAYLNASRYESVGEDASGESNPASQFLERGAGTVIRNQIVKVRKFNYSGHVYDVQAAGGWLLGDGIIVSNCRCSWSPVTVEQAARRGVTEAMAWMERAKAMTEQLGGVFEQYLNRTAPANPEFVSPPSFQPSPEFVRK